MGELAGRLGNERKSSAISFFSLPVCELSHTTISLDERSEPIVMKYHKAKRLKQAG